MNLKKLGANQTELTIEQSNRIIQVLFSYETPVAAVVTEKSNGNVNHFRTAKKFSRTTSKHILLYRPSEFGSFAVMPQEWFDELVK